MVQLAGTCIYLGPRSFPTRFFSAWESGERAAKRWTWVTMQRERKTSGYFGLESHFCANTRVRIWPSGSDWLIFLQTRKSIWLVGLIGNTEGTVGIFVTALLVVKFWLYLYQTKNLLAKHCSSQFTNIQDSSVFYITFVFDSVFEGIWPWSLRSIFQRWKVSPNVNVLLAVINCKDVFGILPTGMESQLL